jgi:two-component sensor histidine kinase
LLTIFYLLNGSGKKMYIAWLPMMNKWIKYGVMAGVCTAIAVLVTLFLQEEPRPFPDSAVTLKDTLLADRWLVEADSIFYSKEPDSQRIRKVFQLTHQADSISVPLQYYKGLGKSSVFKAKAWHVRGNKDSTRYHARQAIEVCSDHHIYIQLASALYQLGETYELNDAEIERRIKYTEEAARNFDRGGMRNEGAVILQVTADFCMIANDLFKSRRLLHKAITIFNECGVKDTKGAYDLLNQVEVSLGNYRKAYEYGLKAVEKIRESNDSLSPLICTIYNRTGIALYKLNKHDSAVIFYRRSLTLAEYNHDLSAIRQLTSNLLVGLNGAQQYDSMLAVVQRYRRQPYPPSKNFDLIIDYLRLSAYLGKGDMMRQKALSDSLRMRLPGITDNDYTQYGYLQVITSDLKRGRFHAAHALMPEAERVFRRNERNDGLQSLYALKIMSDTLARNYRAAIGSSIWYKSLTDSIFLITRDRQVAKLEKQFRAEALLQDELKMQRTQLIEANIQLREKELTQTKTGFFIFLVCSLLLAVFVVVTYRIYTLKQKNNLLVRQQKESTDQQNASLKKLVDKQVKLIAEKEWLIKEVHHRVKNNLQVVVSLLSFQSRYLTDEAARDAIVNSQNRVRSMSIIHQQLYQDETLKYVNISKYIQVLISYLRDVLNPKVPVRFETDILNGEMDVADVVPIGLILNEAITNAVKYAFVGKQQGIISISLIKNGEGYYVLTIADDGVGLPEGFDAERSNTLGFNLMHTMSEELHASFTIRQSEGLQLLFLFRERKNK